MATKASDVYLVPLCHECHVMRHQVGFKSFWEMKFPNQDVTWFRIFEYQLGIINNFLSTQQLRRL